jgi:hypothetical protein
MSCISQAENDGFVPSEIEKLVGKTILFKVMTSYATSSSYDCSFRVRRVCIDEAIIELFLADGDVYSPSKVANLFLRVLIYLVYSITSLCLADIGFVNSSSNRD